MGVFMGVFHGRFSWAFVMAVHVETQYFASFLAVFMAVCHGRSRRDAIFCVSTVPPVAIKPLMIAYRGGVLASKSPLNFCLNRINPNALA